MKHKGLKFAFTPGTEPSREEQDRAFRELLITITRRWSEEVMGIQCPQGKCLCVCSLAMLPYEALDVSHIEKRSTHPELIYSLDNVQLIARTLHEKQERREIDKDLRPKTFKNFILRYRGLTVNG